MSEKPPKNNLVSLEEKGREKNIKETDEIFAKIRQGAFGHVETREDAANMLIFKYEAMQDLLKGLEDEKPPEDYYTNDYVAFSYDDSLRDRTVEAHELLLNQWKDGTPLNLKGDAIESLFDQGRTDVIQGLADQTDLLKFLNIRSINKIEKTINLHRDREK